MVTKRRHEWAEKGLPPAKPCYPMVYESQLPVGTVLVVRCPEISNPAEIKTYDIEEATLTSNLIKPSQA